MLFLVTNAEPRPHGPWHTPERHSGCLDHWVGQHMAGTAIIHPVMFVRGYAMYIEVDTGAPVARDPAGQPHVARRDLPHLRLGGERSGEE